MFRLIAAPPRRRALACLFPLLGLLGCSASRPPAAAVASPTRPAAVVVVAEVPPPRVNYPPSAYTPVGATPRTPVVAPPIFPVMLGIDTLEADGFDVLKGKRIGLLTHLAAVNRRGVTTIDVLRHAPGVRLVALFAAEHDLDGQVPAGTNYKDHLDPHTGLMVHSLYYGVSSGHKPNRAQLKGIDAFVIDLQDIGTRSYTFISALKAAMEGCFENGVEVVVLDRPNPLGGLKVSGPPLDAQWVSYVGAFRVPYVHGLTMGELARMAAEAPGVLAVPDAVRARGRLVVVPMRGWHRRMRWPETGLKWVPTSPHMPDFATVEGCPMTGLGCQIPGTFTNGVGNQYMFRGISWKGIRAEVLERELRALRLPGLDFHRVSVPSARTGQPATGLFIEITDWDAWEPTELNFYLMRLACQHSPRNPFATVTREQANLFLKLMGSTAFFDDLAAHGARVDVDAYIREWRAKAVVYQRASRKYWLYD
jgi:uncharacterized protein YbbC (DUF1343 family)